MLLHTQKFQMVLPAVKGQETAINKVIIRWLGYALSRLTLPCIGRGDRASADGHLKDCINPTCMG